MVRTRKKIDSKARAALSTESGTDSRSVSAVAAIPQSSPLTGPELIDADDAAFLQDVIAKHQLAKTTVSDSVLENPLPQPPAKSTGTLSQLPPGYEFFGTGVRLSKQASNIVNGAVDDAIAEAKIDANGRSKFSPEKAAEITERYLAEHPRPTTTKPVWWRVSEAEWAEMSAHDLSFNNSHRKLIQRYSLAGLLMETDRGKTAAKPCRRCVKKGTPCRIDTAKTTGTCAYCKWGNLSVSGCDFEEAGPSLNAPASSAQKRTRDDASESEAEDSARPEKSRKIAQQDNGVTTHHDTLASAIDTLRAEVTRMIEDRFAALEERIAALEQDW